MKRLLALCLAVALVSLGMPVPAAAGPSRDNSQISGIARGIGQQPLANHAVRVRNVGTGQVVATSRTNASGQFFFTGLGAGQYVVELVDASGKVVGATQPLMAGGTAVADVSVAASGAAAGAAGGAGSFFGTTKGILILAAAGAAAAVVIWAAAKSPSQ